MPRKTRYRCIKSLRGLTQNISEDRPCSALTRKPDTGLKELSAGMLAEVIKWETSVVQIEAGGQSSIHHSAGEGSHGCACDSVTRYC